MSAEKHTISLTDTEAYVLIQSLCHLDATVGECLLGDLREVAKRLCERLRVMPRQPGENDP